MHMSEGVNKQRPLWYRIPVRVKGRLLIATLGIICIFGAIATNVVYNQVKETYYENQTENLESLLSRGARVLWQSFVNSHDLIGKLADRHEVRDYLLQEHPTLQDEELLTLFEGYNIGDRFSAIYVMNTEGSTLVSTDPTFVDQNFGFRDYFKQALSGEQYSDVAIGVISDELGYYFSAPVSDEDSQIIGVVVAKLKPGYIQDRVLMQKPRDESHVLLVEEHGVIVAADRTDRLLQSLGTLSSSEIQSLRDSNRFGDTEIVPLDYDEAQRIVEDYQGTTIYDAFDEEDNETELIAISKVPDYPFYLIMEDEQEYFLGTAQEIGTTLALFVGSAAVSSGIAILFFVSAALRPLKKLEDTVTEIRKGNLDAKVDLRTNDEFESLGNLIDLTTGELKEYRDHTERIIADRTRKLEELTHDLEKFKLAVEQASDHIVITDSNGLILFANQSVRRITGFRIDEIMGKKAGGPDLWGGQMGEKFYQKMWKTIKLDKKPFSGEIKNKRKNEEPYTALATISPILDKEGDVDFFVGIERDITKEKQVDQAKTEFVSLASHQLRTPLTAIGWYTEMLLNGDGGKLTKEQNTFLKEISHGNSRMVDLVNALLNVSRLELGTFSVEPEKTDIETIAKSLFKELGPDIHKKQLKIRATYGKNIPKIMADPKLLRIVIQNLLSNAVKYTPAKGSVSLTLRKAKKKIQLEVADTGYGIPKSQQNRIFEKLFRADNVRVMETEGTGLGLYLVKSILDSTGGSISFVSTEGKGTTFKVTVPISGMKAKKGTRKLE
jgi:PAS domain S-box-containing protein